MKAMPIENYRPYPSVDLPNRQWPSKVIEKAPIWCSVDLRDGNQALVNPMTIKKKLEMFKLLVEMGFKEIEVGFPSAAEVEFEFVRKLIDEQLIPDDVSIQVLTQTRDHLIERTYQAIAGAKRAIVHIYNSTSEAQRRVVFQSDRAGIVDIAVRGAELALEYAKALNDTEVIFQYSPKVSPVLNWILLWKFLKPSSMSGSRLLSKKRSSTSPRLLSCPHRTCLRTALSGLRKTCVTVSPSLSACILIMTGAREWQPENSP